MSPVFNDKFDALMHLKRQEETGSNTISNIPSLTTVGSTATPAPPSTISSTSNTPTPTPPNTTGQLTTSASSSVLTTTSSTSSVISTSSALTSTSISTTSTLPTSTSAVVTTTAPTTAPTTAATSTAASLTSRTVPTVTPSIIRTTSNGQIFTVTAIVGATDTASTSSSAGKPFFKNTGAVVGVFVVVGIVAAALLFVLGTMFIRRRRAKQFDREVQEAAREAAHTQPAIDDDDDYAGATSYNTHSSQPMNTERPGGYGGYGAAASSWDPYGRAAAAGGTGYEMQHRRTSTGTGAGPGIAGFATGDVFARNAAPEPQGYNNQGYGQGYAQDSYNTGYGQGYGGNQQYNNQAYNTSPPQAYALAQPQTQAGRVPAQAQMMMPEAQRHSYNNVGAFRQSPSYGEAHPGEHVEYGHAVQDDDPYGGYEPYEAGPSQTQSQGHVSNPPAYAAGTSGTAGATGDRKGHMARQPSASGRSGATRYSDDEDDVEPPRRVLKVANE